MQRRSRLSVGKTNVPLSTTAVVAHAPVQHTAEEVTSAPPIVMPAKPRQTMVALSPTKRIHRRATPGPLPGESEGSASNRPGSKGILESKDDEEFAAEIKKGLAHRQVSQAR